ncbi:CPBP family intramembrane metalloprotease [Tissierella sp. MSJ-40]|uniref:CPBP family intramembrane metalloprotease n=1 Tax=Tissierella simiarum TaxID=2841534 RepID=A0ABS6E6G5_9FIRM|nr:CPBP family intramembrane glutamic endopeptidase [Tissierella simiarum]MBU5438431.1 CPBP family intramembrane metalloprotease [Tissierella simiarum]
MEELNENDIPRIANKMGKFIIIGFFIEVFFVIFLNEPLVNLLHRYESLSKSDPIEIDMLVRSSLSSLSLIIVALFIFKVNIKDIFSNKNQIYELSLKTKIKLTLFFISIALFSAIVSSPIMVAYTKYVSDIPVPETTLFLSIFAILVAPIIEEILHRGIILNHLKCIGYLFSIIMSSIYFGAIHGIGFLHSFIIGLILGSACVLTGNIRWSIIMHFIYNLILTLIEKQFLPLFSNMSHNIGKLIIGIILLLIFLITSIKDKELKELHKKMNIKNIINQFKKDKEKYIIFINEPRIAILTVGWIFIQLIPLFMLGL